MRNVHIDYTESDLNFESASLLAKNFAKENRMRDPTIMAWHHSSDEVVTPFYDGANADTWWAKYGAGNGGMLEICVGDDYQFILMDARAFEKVGEVPLRNLTDDQGNQYLCHTPIQGKVTDKPLPQACAQLDGWAADQY